MKESIRTGGKIPLSLNVAMVLLLFVFFVLSVGKKSANFSFLGILALLPAISILTFAMEVPGRTLLVLCWVGNSVASVLGALAALMFFLMVSRAATFGMVVIFFLFYSLVAMSSALAAFKLWKRTREEISA